MNHIWSRSAAALKLAAAAGAVVAQAAAPAAAETITVQRGESFSQIAARLIGDASQWRKLYDPQRSNLPNPDVIQVGLKLEVVTEADGRRYLRALGPVARRDTPAGTAAKPATAAAAPRPAAAAPGAPAAPTAAAVPEAPLVIGVLPNIAPAALLVQYEQVKRYLERQGQGKVQVVVPPNFKAFFDATMAGEYDVAVAAPHMARVAQLDRGLQPLGMYEPRIGALLVAPSDSAVSGPRDMAGKVVAFANPQSLVAMFGQQWLRGVNLEPGRDYEIKGARTDLGVGRLLLTGEAVGAIMSNGEFRALPPDESARLRIVESFARIPNFIWLAHPRIERTRVERLRSQMRTFFTDPGEGAAFAKATGLGGFVDADDATLRELDPFAAATRRALGVSR